MEHWQQLAAPAALMVIMVLLFWQIVIRPTQAQQKRHQRLVDELRPGDRVITAGGMYGKIMTVSERTVGLEIAKGITINLDRRAIRRRQSEGEV
jgi:preprotein translocase subunit YajC